MDIIGRRLEKVIEHQKLSINKFASMIGVSQQRISHLKRSEKISSDILEKVLQAFPDINTQWLLIGHGPMLIKDIQDNTMFMGKELLETIGPAMEAIIQATSGNIVKELRVQVNDKERIIAEKDRYIKVLESHLSHYNSQVKQAQ